MTITLPDAVGSELERLAAEGGFSSVAAYITYLVLDAAAREGFDALLDGRLRLLDVSELVLQRASLKSFESRVRINGHRVLLKSGLRARLKC